MKAQENYYIFDDTVYNVGTPNLNSTSVICSKRNTGKSKLVLNLIYNMVSKYDFQLIVLFSNTAKYLDDYNFLNKKFIFPLEDDKIHKIMKYQEQMRSKKKTCNCLMVLDDVNIEKKSSALNEVFTMGRHHYITVIMSVQFPRHVCSRIIRNNIDYLYVSELNNETLYNIIKECVVIPGIDSKEIFNFIMNSNHNYQYILYDNTEKDKEKLLKVVRAKLLELKMIRKK